MRFVIDTNVIVSAYLGGTLETVLRSFKEGQFTLVVTDAIANEYFTVLQRPKFKIERDEFDDFVALLMSKAEFVIPTETVTAIESDPSDNKFLEAALAGKARRIVSGDNHLLELKTYRGISILTAREFLDGLAAQAKEK
jgi:putative PIN family toxin of toxin-antitoxin system